jgi:hypothetical protein
MPGIPGFPTVNSDSTVLAYDPEAALLNMAIALEELGVAEPKPSDVQPATETCDDTCQHTRAWARMLGPLKFGFSCDAGHDLRVLFMANSWRTTFGFTGPQMDIRCTDGWGTFGTWRFPPVYDVRRNGWGADFPHPDNQNRDLFACGVRNNNSKYCNPAYDALLNRAAQAATYDEALPFYQQAEQTLVNDAPVLFLRYGEAVRLVRPWVLGIVPTAADHQNIGDMHLEDVQIVAH